MSKPIRVTVLQSVSRYHALNASLELGSASKIQFSETPQSRYIDSPSPFHCTALAVIQCLSLVYLSKQVRGVRAVDLS